MKTAKHNKNTDKNTVLCSIMPTHQFLIELNADKDLAQFLDSLMSNQRKLNLKN